MNQRQASPRAWYIAILLGITILVLFSRIAGLWLGIAPPAVLAPYRSWFQIAYNNVYGGIISTLGIIFTVMSYKRRTSYGLGIRTNSKRIHRA